MTVSRRGFIKGLLAGGAVVAAAPILTIGQEDIYWLLTSKGMVHNILREADEPTPKCARAIRTILRAEHGGFALMGESSPLDLGSAEYARRRSTWLAWGEDEYARMLDSEARDEILYLVDKYGSRVFYRDETDLFHLRKHSDYQVKG